MNDLYKIMFDRVNTGVITDDVWRSFCFTFMFDMIDNNPNMVAMLHRMKNDQYQ